MVLNASNTGKCTSTELGTITGKDLDNGIKIWVFGAKRMAMAGTHGNQNAEVGSVGTAG